MKGLHLTQLVRIISAAPPSNFPICSLSSSALRQNLIEGLRSMFLLLQATRQLTPNTDCFVWRRQTEQLKPNEGLMSHLLLQNRQRGIHHEERAHEGSKARFKSPHAPHVPLSVCLRVCVRAQALV